MSSGGTISTEPVNLSLSFSFVSSLASVVAVSSPALLLYSELRNKQIVLQNPYNIWEIVFYIVTGVLVIYISLIAMFIVLFRVSPISSKDKIDTGVAEGLYGTLRRRTIVISILIVFAILFTIGTFVIFYIIFRPIIEQDYSQKSQVFNVLIILFYAVAIIGLVINLFIAVFSKDVIFLQLIYRSSE
jgi:phage shock protein PspC (stress-responsive transcriptional regulator)